MLKQKLPNNIEDFLKMYIEIEYNARDDSVFERMTLTRMEQYAKKHWNIIIPSFSKEARQFLLFHSFYEWKEEKRRKLINVLLPYYNP